MKVKIIFTEILTSAKAETKERIVVKHPNHPNRWFFI